VADDIHEQVLEIVAEQMGRSMEQIRAFGGDGRACRFREDLEADSLDSIEIIMEVEDGFRISISDSEAEKLATIGAAVDFVREKCQ
jgi:acyl carrier protein